MRWYTSYTNRRHKSYGAGILPGDPVHTRGWNAGVKVTPREAGPDGKQDTFEVYMTGGSHAAGHEVLLGTVLDTPDGPAWMVAETPPARPATTDDGQVIAKPDGPTAEDHAMARNALQLAIDTLLGHDCTFDMCPGPDVAFVDMMTCRVCSSIQDLRAELARITR